MNGLNRKKFSLVLSLLYLSIAWLTVINVDDTKDAEEEYSDDKIVEESRKLQESASKTIKEGSQKFKERYIDDDENTSDKLKEDAAKIRKIYMEGAENAAQKVIEKSGPPVYTAILSEAEGLRTNGKILNYRYREVICNHILSDWRLA